VCLDDDGKELDYADRIRTLRNVVKEAEFFVGFNIPLHSAALKILEIHIMREDVPRFLTRGKSTPQGDSEASPFLQALSTYAQDHLALDLKHEQVRITRIACGGFVLGMEGKVKLGEPIASELRKQQARATETLVDGLVEIAATRNFLLAKT